MRNTNRATWVEALVPYGNQIISQLPNINWNSFEYTGPVEVDVPESENAGFSLAAVNRTLSGREIIEATAKSGKNPYGVFGGAACELWASVIPVPNIRDFVDPTGDIDVKIRLPLLTVLKDHTGEYDDPTMYLATEDGFTDLGDQYSRWLFNEVVRVYSPLAKDFDKPVFSVPDISEDDELKLADIAEFYGNLLFTRMITRDKSNIKVQVSIKVTTETSTVVNHLLEFLIITSGQSYSPTEPSIRGIPVPPPWQLFTEQVKGLTGRSEVVLAYWQKKPAKMGKVNKIQSFHKIDNHCGRLLYLALLQKEVEGKPWPFDNPRSRYWFPKLTIHQVVSGATPLFKTKSIPMCGYHFRDFRQHLFSIFDTYEMIPKGVLTNRTKPIAQKFNELLYKGGGRTRKRGGGCGCGLMF